jgi:methyl-accepting chemotaxis protein
MFRRLLPERLARNEAVAPEALSGFPAGTSLSPASAMPWTAGAVVPTPAPFPGPPAGAGEREADGLYAIIKAQDGLLDGATTAAQLMLGVTAAIDKLAVASGMARSTAGAMSDAMDGLRRSSVMISAELGRSGAAADQVTAFAARTREGADALGLSVNEIGAIVDLIAGLARQTSYLAINAAIEAARAGEAGRGFSVVAAEVKTLAHATRDATEQVAAVIHRVRANARRNIDGVTALDSAIADLRGALGRVGGALEIQAQSAHEIADSSAEALRMADLVETERHRVAQGNRLSLAAVENLKEAARSSRALCLALPLDARARPATPGSGVRPAGEPPPCS